MGLQPLEIVARHTPEGAWLKINDHLVGIHVSSNAPSGDPSPVLGDPGSEPARPIEYGFASTEQYEVSAVEDARSSPVHVSVDDGQVLIIHLITQESG